MTENNQNLKQADNIYDKIVSQTVISNNCFDKKKKAVKEIEICGELQSVDIKDDENTDSSKNEKIDENDSKKDINDSGKSSKKDKNKDSEDAIDIAEVENSLKKLRKILIKKSGFEEGQRRSDGKKGGLKLLNEGGIKNNFKTFFIWIAIIVIALVAMNYFNDSTGIMEFKSLNDFQEHIKDVKSIKIKNIGPNAKIEGSFISKMTFPDKQGEFSGFKLIYPIVPIKEAQEWIKDGIVVKFDEENNTISNFLLSLVPWLLILVLWIYLFKRMQGGGQGGGKSIFTFGKSKARLIDDTNNKITFKDVAGAEEAKEELKEIIDFLENPKEFLDIGARIPRGVLLTGPPGTGKTLLAKAVAGEAGAPFFSMSGADFVEMFVGVGASRVRDLFAQSKKNSPCILFIDELDAVGRHRGTGIGGGNDEREQTLNQLLVEMDGFDTDNSVIVIAATNRPDVLDPALLRPGRFDRHIIVDNPDVRAREQILAVHAKKVKTEDEIDLEVIAKGTPGLSGADLANLINEAALFAARNKRKKITNNDIEEAKDKVMMGAERKSAVINEEEKKITAYHEAGHVLIAKFTKGSDPVHKVTIIPRGRAMGVTHYLPIEEKHSYSKTYVMGKLLHLFGGRVAEELIFNDITTGASNDIESATDLARKMVCEWGMSEDVGPIHYGVKNDNPFLGKELTRTSSISEEIGKKIDNAVQKIIFDAMAKTRVVLSENIDMLHKLAEKLIEKETLTGAEIDELLAINLEEA